MRLTLLRAARYPDPDADRGRHRFTYAAAAPRRQPRRGAGRVVGAQRARRASCRAAPAPPVVAVDHPGVVVTAVKAADDGSGDLVVRLHEAFGGRARATLRTAGGWSTAVACDLLERPVAEPETGRTARWRWSCARSRSGPCGCPRADVLPPRRQGKGRQMTNDKIATRVLGVGFAAALLLGGAACGDDDDSTTTDDDITDDVDGMDAGDGLGGTDDGTDLGDLGDPNDPGEELED